MDIVRAWKDPEYREQFEQSPEHPAGNGLSRIDESGLDNVAGGRTERLTTLGCCNALYTLTTAIPAYCVVTVNLCN